MKILLTGPVPAEIGGKGQGGVGQHVWNLARNLVANGYDVTLMPTGSFFGKDNFKEGVHIKGWNFNLLLVPKAIFIALKYIYFLGLSLSIKDLVYVFLTSLRIFKIKNINKYNICHNHAIYNGVNFVLSQSDNKPLIVQTIHSYHDIIFRENRIKERKKFFQRNIDLADCIIHVSKADQLTGKKLGFNHGDQHFIHYNALEPSGISGQKSRNSICFIGSLDDRKRIKLVLDAYLTKQNNTLPLLIAGDGPLAREVQQITTSNKNVKFYGSVNNPTARKIMSRSSVLVGPSKSESFGLIYIEAILEGAAVIGYSNTLNEFKSILSVTEDEAKLMISYSPEDKDPEKLMKLIDKTNDFRNSKRGNDSMNTLQEKVRSHFGWSKSVEKLIGIYTEISENKVK